MNKIKFIEYVDRPRTIKAIKLTEENFQDVWEIIPEDRKTPMYIDDNKENCFNLVVSTDAKRIITSVVKVGDYITNTNGRYYMYPEARFEVDYMEVTTV